MKILRTFLTILFIFTSLLAYSKVVDKVVAIIGNKVITNYEIETFNPPEIKKIYSTPDENERAMAIKKYYKNVLDFLVEQYIVEISAEKDGVTVTDKEVEMAINEILKENNITIKLLEELLAKENLPLNQYKWQLKVELLNRKIRSQILSPLMVVTEEDIQNYIEKNKQTLQLEDRYELRTILIENEHDFKKVMDYLKNKGSFADAAIKFSKDLSAKSGGYLGWINKKDMAENIGNIIGTKKKGDIFHIKEDNKIRIFLIENYQNKGEVGPDTKEKIVDKIREEKYSNLYKNWLDRHKKNIFVKYME